MRSLSLLTGPGFKVLSVRSFLSVCIVFTLLAVFFGMSGAVAHAQIGTYYVNMGDKHPPDSLSYNAPSVLTGDAGARQACALFQEQGTRSLRTALDENFRNRSLLSGFSDSKFGAMAYARGSGAIDSALNASCAALTGTGGGDSALSGFDADMLKDMAFATAFGEGLGFLQSSGLPFTGRLEVSGSLYGRVASGFEVLTVQPLWHDASEQNHVFTQLSWNRTIGREGYVDGSVLNAGLAYRRLSEDRSIVYGLNAFIDHAPERDHNRMSVGADVQTEQIGVSANKYIPLSDWKSVNSYKEERAASGFDLELQGRLPEFPSWQVNLKGFQWSSNEDMEGKTTWGYDAGVQWQPVNALVWEAGLRNEQDASPQFHTQLRMVYKFGEPLEKMWERPVAISDMRHRVYDKVRRDNAMRVEQRVKESAYVTVTQNVGANTALLETGAVLALSVGQELPRPFTVTTDAAPGSVARLSFRDGGVLTIGNASQVRVEADVVTLISGLFQYVSGSTNVLINIPGGTVTLLGTDIDVSSNGGTSVLRVRDGAARLDGTSAGSVTLGVAQAAASVNGVVGGALAPNDPVYIAHTDDVSEKIDRAASPLTGVKVAPYPYKAPEIVAAGTVVGDTVKIGVTFNAGVSVTGTPQLAFTIGGNGRTADYSAGDSTAEQMVFVYTLLAADAGATTVTTHGIGLNGGAITGDGKDAVITMADTELSLSAAVVNPDPCAVATPAPGTVCADGTLFMGFHPVTNAKLFAMTQDAPTTLAWNDGTADDRYNLLGPMANCPAISDSGTVTTGVRSRDPVHPNPLSADPNKAVVTAGCHEGETMSDYLATLDADIDGPYQAAEYCANLAPPDARALGHDDWYLPSINELSVMFVNLGPQPKFNFQNAYYWSSSELNTTSAWSQHFTTGSQHNGSKNDLSRVRCLRQ